MFATRKPYARVSVPLRYNEHKVSKGQAECIYAGNFLRDAPELTLIEKRQHFDDILDRNQRASRPTMHFCLQFCPGENFENQRLADIATSFMERVGYGAQPYLVYRHRDIAIQHLHIVAISIRWDGTLIRSYTPMRGPHPAVRAVEMEFGLQEHLGTRLIQSGPPRRIEYGVRPSVEAIANVLQYVLPAYRFRSVPELNAILLQYNLKALTGRPGSRLHRLGGLIYVITDQMGRGRSAPVKACKIPFKPTLKRLKARFEECRFIDPAVISQTRLALQSAMKVGHADRLAFQDALRRNRLAVAPDRNPEGDITGLLLVSFAAKSVVNSLELGPDYSYPSIRRQLAFDPLELTQTTDAPKQTIHRQRKKGRSL